MTLKPLRRCHRSGICDRRVRLLRGAHRQEIPCLALRSAPEKCGLVRIVARWPRALSAAPSAMKGCTSPALPMVGNNTLKRTSAVAESGLASARCRRISIAAPDSPFELCRQNDRRVGALHAVERADSIDDLIHFSNRRGDRNRDQVHIAADGMQQPHLRISPATPRSPRGSLSGPL